MKKIISMILVLSCIFTVAGCTNYIQEDDTPKAVDTVIPVNMGYVEGTTHIFNATETSEYLIENKHSDYKILVPDDYKANSYLENAATDLQLFLNESTGAVLEIVEEKDFENGQKYISLGDTLFATAKGVSYDVNVLGTQGYTIKTVDKNIFISGATGFAILWGVYGLLEYECGYDWFYGNIHSLETRDKITLKNYNFIDIPDIEMRITNYGSSTYTGAYRRMRYTLNSDVMLWGVHSAMNVIQYSVYGEEHPDWFADTKTQLCYNAKGNAEEYELLLETVATAAFGSMQENPSLSLVCFSDADNFDYCNCEACVKISEKYGARSANSLLFSKDLAKKLKEKLVAANDNRAETFSVSFLSYNRTETAPVQATIDPKTGEMSFEYAEELVSENVTVWYAPIGSVFSESILDKANTGLYKNLFSWGKLCQTALYGYDTNFAYYLLPHDTTDALQDLYKACRKARANFVLNQGQSYAVANTGWSYLKNYLTSKFAWDVNADSQVLIEKFFKGMYGSQSGRMQKVYEEYHTLAEIQANVWNCPKGQYVAMLNAKYWPESLLTDWINELLDIEKTLLENNESLAYVQNVRAELVSYLYLYIELYEKDSQASLIHEYAQKFVSIVSELGFSWLNEATPINELVNEYSNK